MKTRRRIKGQLTRTVTITVDPITDTMVKALAKRDGLTFSGALCVLATDAGIRDADLFAHAKGTVIAPAVRERLESDGWHPGLSAVVARELVTGEPSSEKLVWS